LDPSLARIWIGRFERQQRRYGPPQDELLPVALALLGNVLPADCGWVLDLGCGPGSLARRVARAMPGTRVTGVDRDRFLLTLGRALGGADFVEADLGGPGWAGAAGVESGHVDAVVAWSVVHVLDEQRLRDLYRELADIIRPGGILLVADRLPDDADPLAPARAAVRSAWVADNVRPADETWEEWWAAVSREPRLRRLAGKRTAEGVADPPQLAMGTHARLMIAAGFACAGQVWVRGDDMLMVARR